MGTSTGRGVDNTVAGWTTDYMLAVILAYLAWRLFNRGASGAAISTQLCMAGGYFFGALGHHLFPSRAMDSPCADARFYVVWSLSYLCQGASCISWAVWADRTVGWKSVRNNESMMNS